MPYYNRSIQRAAVLGAGVMGAQIAAHLANAGVPVLLFELAADDGDANANVLRALQGLEKLKPAPYAHRAARGAVTPRNYREHLSQLQDCDLVIEAITERMDWKHQLYEQVMPHLRDDCLFASNTSGLGIGRLSEELPASLQRRFCGVHFFNPPRYMHLLELIPGPHTGSEVLDTLEEFFTTTLGKGVVRAKDTPSFIGNRVGVFSMLAVLHHAQRLALPLDLVDKLTGPGIGHPKSATLRTADVVGLDTFAHVVSSMHETLADDPWREYYRVPDWLKGLIDAGSLGQKTGIGVYRKQGRELQVLDYDTGGYRRVRSALSEPVRAILIDPDPASKFAALSALADPQADFLRAIHLDLFHFCAYWLGDIAHSARDIDLAMRWGYGWQLGPFEIWQAAGWQAITEQLQQRIADGTSMSDAALPDWVGDGRNGVHGPQGSWSAADGCGVARSTHPVYRRQAAPDRVLGETDEAQRHTIFATDAVRCWHAGDDIAVLSFRTKMHTISPAVLDGIHQALDRAIADYQALILWQPTAPFSVGADLKKAMAAGAAGEDALRELVQKFQQTSLALRHAPVPTVAAVQGMVFGGGCEFMLHCDRTVAALESYIGLVEAGVGLIPGAGGTKEMALRAADLAGDGDRFAPVARHFETLALAKVAGSALEARELGFLRAEDKVVFNAHELLHVARHEARALFEAGYRAPLPRNDIPVAGSSAIATLRARMVNMLEGGFISEHDYHVGSVLAEVICGGDLDPGTRVHQDWFMRLEQDAFLTLTAQPKTRERIDHTLQTGKPLRN
ncbi:MAG: 3-hydroxyacyl-CoA dehydrogenase/enoyl-CoA hydratase family protein [Gammaproteobacteria bacterium]|nr:3-hydroxyacyl-CoA dehydrogenase/enoyl-CoA hydratase family protein [Gammaproteobacteria bacterium]